MFNGITFTEFAGIGGRLKLAYAESGRFFPENVSEPILT
jgi:hypothetical protein